MKITPMKYLMCRASNNQATKQSVWKLYTQAKVENNERKKERTQKNLFTQFGPI